MRIFCRIGKEERMASRSVQPSNLGRDSDLWLAVVDE
jgi:hypothetical protein